MPAALARTGRAADEHKHHPDVQRDRPAHSRWPRVRDDQHHLLRVPACNQLVGPRHHFGIRLVTLVLTIALSMQALRLLSRGARSRQAFWAYAGNSIVVAVASTVQIRLPATPAAYALTVRPVRKTQDVLFFFTSTKMMPVATGIIPTYVVAQHPHLRTNLLLAVWMIRSFLQEVPGEALEAAADEYPYAVDLATATSTLPCQCRSSRPSVSSAQPKWPPSHSPHLRNDNSFFSISLPGRERIAGAVCRTTVVRRAGGSAVRACRRRRRDRCRWWSRRAGSPGRRCPRRPLPR